ncbi:MULTISPECIES: hypothetical protein [unclassified Polaribacter]|jgi:hypothetical protein|uniref:hypothetical protein n=1 Tax=unclassified Polaribacter TaxID=196858 RepID=UPI001C4FAB54|nr:MULTISPECIES: hypothetical protein [unclassified Polaribacter]QXP65035.1 hypothetical protein H0I27_07645 [Polaribacter sp. HaHaR_3_91]QXP67529.1 hypothetical protein H0I28_03240 [Polaribacter sp. AHE13PA]QXP69687.1 hypothetical protein H0I29_13830 [Polaribacter sp. R2A056_3_33]
MELIYKNKYGASYKVNKYPNQNYEMQIVIGSVGVFMAENELDNLLDVVRGSHVPCNCDSCKGERCNKIWTTSELVDTCIKVDDTILGLLEDLILGTQFILNIDDILDEYRIK